MNDYEKMRALTEQLSALSKEYGVVITAMPRCPPAEVWVFVHRYNTRDDYGAKTQGTEVRVYPTAALALQKLSQTMREYAPVHLTHESLKKVLAYLDQGELSEAQALYELCTGESFSVSMKPVEEVVPT